MAKVVADISMSLDGFVTGPDPDVAQGLGRGGEPLHTWAVRRVRLGLDFTFVTTGLDAAIDQARTAAGQKDVFVMGGADVVRQCVDAGLADELRIHLAPILLGAGTPLFAGSQRRQLVQRSVRVSPTATHLTYDVHG